MRDSIPHCVVLPRLVIAPSGIPESVELSVSSGAGCEPPLVAMIATATAPATAASAETARSQRLAVAAIMIDSFATDERRACPVRYKFFQMRSVLVAPQPGFQAL